MSTGRTFTIPRRKEEQSPLSSTTRIGVGSMAPGSLLTSISQRKVSPAPPEEEEEGETTEEMVSSEEEEGEEEGEEGEEEEEEEKPFAAISNKLAVNPRRREVISPKLITEKAPTFLERLRMREQKEKVPVVANVAAPVKRISSLGGRGTLTTAAPSLTKKVTIAPAAPKRVSSATVAPIDKITLTNIAKILDLSPNGTKEELRESIINRLKQA